MTCVCRVTIRRTQQIYTLSLSLSLSHTHVKSALNPKTTQPCVSINLFPQTLAAVSTPKNRLSKSIIIVPLPTNLELLARKMNNDWQKSNKHLIIPCVYDKQGGGDLMENTNPKLPEEGASGTEIDWRTQLSIAYRQMIISKLSEWLNRSISTGPRDKARIEEIATKFEAKVFSFATSKEDYQKRIWLKLQQQIKPRPQQSMPMSSPSVKSSLHQEASPQQYNGPGRSLATQPGLPPSVVNHPLMIEASPQQHNAPGRPLTTQPGLPPSVINHPLMIEASPQQHNAPGRPLTTQPGLPPPVVNHPLPHHHQRPPFIHHQSNVIQERAVPDLLTQQRLYGLNNNHSSGNMPVQKTELQPPAQQTQPANQQQRNLQIPVQPQENKNIQEGTVQTVHPIGDDLREELFNKITYLKNSCLPALMQKNGEIARVYQKMHASQQQNTVEYERVQRLLIMHRKVHSFLNFPKDKMSEEIQKWLPQCEKLIYSLLQVRSIAQISSPQQIQPPTNNAESVKNPVNLNSQTEQRTNTAQVEERVLQHSQQLNQKNNVKPIQNMGAEKVNILQNEFVDNCSRSNHRVVKSEPVSTPEIIILEESSGNIENISPSPMSVDPISTSSVKSVIKENQTLVGSVSGISPSNLIRDNVNIRGNNNQNTDTDMSEQILPEEPIQRLIKAVGSMSHYAFNSSVSDMESVLRMGDMTAPQITRNKPDFVFGENLAKVTTCRYGLQQDFINSQAMQKNSYETDFPFSFSESDIKNNGFSHLTDPKAVHFESFIAANEKKQKIEARANAPEFANDENLDVFGAFCYGMEQEVNLQKMQRNLYSTAFPVQFFESGKLNYGLKNQTDLEASRLESSIAIHGEKTRIEVKCDLREEIRKINRKLIETVVEIIRNDFISESGEEGSLLKFSYTPVSVASNRKSEHSSFLVSAIKPLKVLVPKNYPCCSPVILNNSPSGISMDCDDLSAKAKSKLIFSLGNLQNPKSLADIAKTWDTCARAVISEFAKKMGGGSFSSTYGTWENVA